MRDLSAISPAVPSIDVALARRLEFKADVDALWLGVEELLGAGAGSFLLRPFGEEAATFAARLRAAAAGVTILAADPVPGVAMDNSVTPAPGDSPADVTVLFSERPEELSLGLADRVDAKAGVVLALGQGRQNDDRPLFLISIPKAGTHLAIELLRGLGYRDGGPCPDRPDKKHWYYLEYSNAHTGAPDFFIDTVRRQPFGNRAHPFARSPVLFMYRHPLDILVSESEYYKQDGSTSFAAYLAGLSDEERILRLIDDPRLLGSLRDRILSFAAWLEFPNVIPVSYEELVGGEAGGDDDARESVLWSILLKLQIAGSPTDLTAPISVRAGPTFREGRIGRWASVLSRTARLKLAGQPQDFLAHFGFSASSDSDAGRMPARADAFRRRRLILSPTDFKDTPILAETDYLGHNIVDFRGLYFAVPMEGGPLDLQTLTDEQLRTLVSAPRLSAVRRALHDQRTRKFVESDPHVQAGLQAAFARFFGRSFDAAFGRSFDAAFGRTFDAAFGRSFDPAFDKSFGAAFWEEIGRAYERWAELIGATDTAALHAAMTRGEAEHQQRWRGYRILPIGRWYMAVPDEATVHPLSALLLNLPWAKPIFSRRLWLLKAKIAIAALARRN